MHDKAHSNIVHHINYKHQNIYFPKTHLRGYCTPTQKLAYFVLYLKTVHIFLKNSICIL